MWKGQANFQVFLAEGQSGAGSGQGFSFSTILRNFNKLRNSPLSSILHMDFYLSLSVRGAKDNLFKDLFDRNCFDSDAGDTETRLSLAD